MARAAAAEAAAGARGQGSGVRGQGPGDRGVAGDAESAAGFASDAELATGDRSALAPGTRVRVPSLGLEGELQSVGDDRAYVLVNGRRVRVAAADLVAVGPRGGGRA